MPATRNAHQYLLNNYLASGTFHALLFNDDRDPFSGSTTASSSVISLAGHNYEIGTRIIPSSYTGGAIVNCDEYFVVATVAGTSIEIASTPDGSAIPMDVASSISFTEQGLSRQLITMADAVRREESGYSGNRPVVNVGQAVVEPFQDTYKLTVLVTFDNSSGGTLVEFDGLGLVRNGSVTKGDSTGEIWHSELPAGGPFDIPASSSRTIPIALTLRSVNNA